MSNLVKAIKKLRPEAEFSYVNEDYETIKWNVIDGEAPSKSEINEAIEQVKAEEAQVQAAKEAKRQSALAKLETLGLTADDLKALGL